MSHPYLGPDAVRYADSTWDVDLGPLRDRFTAALPARVAGEIRVLDLGCGSGRDALAFSEAGLLVDAMDASPDLARIAAERTQLPVAVGRAQDLVAEGRYHGIWACASLLHVPSAELPLVFQRLRRALVPGGVLYASFKWGDGDRIQGGLPFADLTPESAETLIRGVPGLVLEATWPTQDARPARRNLVWLNLLARRSDERSDLG